MKIVVMLSAVVPFLLVAAKSKADVFEDAIKVCEENTEIPESFPSCKEFNAAYEEYQKLKGEYETVKAKAEGIANELASFGKIKEAEERIK